MKINPRFCSEIIRQMDAVLQVEGLRTHFITPYGIAKAVDGVSFSVGKEESFGLVGESGCGKSTIAFSIMRMLPSTARFAGGRILLKGREISTIPLRKIRNMWGREMFLIFQDPMTSLNPVMTIGNQLAEAIKRKKEMTSGKQELQDRAHFLLRQVEISDPERILSNYPHQLSGGMKQRIMIAMGIGLSPTLFLMDEPTTALDSTVQFKIVELIRKLKQNQKMSQILITHDFGVAAKICDRIAVMYAGKIVEHGRYTSLLEDPAHPYTQGLFQCILKSGRQRSELEIMEGSLPSLYNLPEGCYFEKRCKKRLPICREHQAELVDLGSGHFVACHNVMAA